MRLIDCVRAPGAWSDDWPLQVCWLGCNVLHVDLLYLLSHHELLLLGHLRPVHLFNILAIVHYLFLLELSGFCRLSLFFFDSEDLARLSQTVQHIIVLLTGSD